MPDLRFERKIWQKGFKYIAGLDEAGRGSLAGPIVSAAVIFKKSKVKKINLRKINDSKLVAPKLREKLFKEIKKIALDWSFAKISSKLIDQKGISWANREVMKLAIKKLKIKPDFLIVDGKINLNDLKIPYLSIVDADKKIFSCSAASILAKVKRDKIMENLDKKFPKYQFTQNKGYPTKKHYHLIKKYGPSPCHRRSFRLK